MRYRQRRGSSWPLLFPGVATGVAVPATIIVVGAVRADTRLVIAGLIIAAFAALPIWNALWILTRTAAEVVLSDEDMTVRPFLGRPTTLRWDEIEELEEHGLWAVSLGLSSQVRVTARDGRRVVLDPRLLQFDELMSTVRERARNARSTRRASGAGEFSLPRWWFALAAGGILAAVGVGILMLAEGKTALGVVCLVLAPIGVGEFAYMWWRFGNRSANSS